MNGRTRAMAAALAVSLLGAGGASTLAQEPTGDPPAGGTLATVQTRGELICGVHGSLPGFSVLDAATGGYSGLDADFCKAIAVAVLGDATMVEYRPLTGDQRGPALQTREVDVLIRNTTHTVSRDTTWGLFGPTIFYDGQGMMVPADSDATTLEDLAGASICVTSGTTTEQNLTDQMAALDVEYTPVVASETPAVYQAYEEGRCDAVTSDRSQLASLRTTLADPAAHVIMDVVMSKEPLAPAVPLGDDQWFNVVKWVVYATIEAEELGITSATVDSMMGGTNPVVQRLLGETGDLGTGLGLANDWAANVIRSVGNYGEIFERNLGAGTPFQFERGLNALWTDDGLLYAPPYR